jgi:hypothetical protein
MPPKTLQAFQTLGGFFSYSHFRIFALASLAQVEEEGGSFSGKARK